MWTRTFRAVVTFGILVVARSTAADTNEPRVMIIRHRPGPADAPGVWAPKLMFAGKNEFFLRPGGKVYFKIVKLPLVFDYSATPTQASLTSDAIAVRGLAARIGALIGAEPGVGGAVPRARPKPAAAASATPSPTPVPKHNCPSGGFGTWVLKAEAEREICSVAGVSQGDLEAFQALSTEFDSLAELIVKAARGNSVTAAEAMTSHTPQDVRAVLERAARAAEGCSLLKSRTVGVSLADSGGGQIDAILSCAAGSTEAPLVLSILGSISDIAARASEMVKMIEAFRKDANPEQESDVLDVENVPRSITYDAERDQTISLTVRRTKRYDALLSKEQIAAIEEAVKNQVGDYVLEFHPRNLVRYRAAGGVVYSMVTRASYEAVKQGEDFYVQANVSGSRNFGAAFMLNVVPVSISDPSFEPYLQIGVGPKEGDPAFYVGAGMMGFGKLSFGLGLAVERTDSLTNGIYPGAKISDPAILKDATYKAFKAGLYFQISVTP